LNLTSCSHLFIPLSYRKHFTIPILKTLLPSLASSGQGELADPACPSLKGVFIVDNTKLGAKGFGAMLEEQEMSGRDFRTIFDREGSGVPGAELSTNDDVINIQFSSGTTGESTYSICIASSHALSISGLPKACVHRRPVPIYGH
jgi:hypothetical protein